MEKSDYSIQFVSKITGINPHTIRAWEKRYSAVVPERNANGRRLYNEQQVERLTMLYDLVSIGNNISDIANHSDEHLKDLHDQFVDKDNLAVERTVVEDIDFNRVLQNLMLALDNYKLDIINHELEKLTANLDPRAFALDLLAPLLHEVGVQVSSKRINIGQEHSLSALIRFHVGKILFGMKRKNVIKDKAIILTTPEGELHEFGIMVGALLCAHYGLNYVYLGVNMPAESLADTAKQIEAGIVLVGVSPFLNKEKPDFTKNYINNLRNQLPDNTNLWIGGGNIDPTQYAAKQIEMIPSLQSLDQALNKVKKNLV